MAGEKVAQAAFRQCVPERPNVILMELNQDGTEMTPFDLKVHHELEAEYIRMANEWFFKWHNINIEGRVVDVDDFFGGRFHTGGIAFWGTIRDLYWRSVAKYLTDMIHRTLERWEAETRSYPVEQRRASIGAVSTALRQHAAKIVTHATDTDQRLRGKGSPESVQPYNSTGIQTAANVTIERLVEAHLSLLGEATPVATEAAQPTMFRRLEGFATEWRGTLALLGIGITVIGAAIKFLIG